MAESKVQRPWHSWDLSSVCNAAIRHLDPREIIGFDRIEVLVTSLAFSKITAGNEL